MQSLPVLSANCMPLADATAKKTWTNDYILSDFPGYKYHHHLGFACTITSAYSATRTQQSPESLLREDGSCTVGGVLFWASDVDLS